MKVARGSCLALAIAIGSIGTVGAEEWIMGTALADEHEVIDNTCSDNFFSNTWMVNKYGNINGNGTLSADGTECAIENKKEVAGTRSGYTAYWILVEDRLDAASYSPEMNYPMLEGGVVIAESGLAIDSDGNEYTWEADVEAWIMGTALTDEHEVIDSTCSDNFFSNTWMVNKYGNINGNGTLSADGTECAIENKKEVAGTRSGYTAYWILVEDRLDAASYSPEMNYPMLEGGVVIAESGLAIDSDGNEYTWGEEADEE